MNPLFLQVALSPDYLGMVQDHRERHLEYCKRFDYVYMMEDDLPGMGLEGGWFRLERTLHHMLSEKYSHIFWIDADVFIADLSQDMCYILPEWAFFAATAHPYPWRGQDAIHIQTGQLYFRCCGEAIDFIQKCLSLRGKVPDDQTAINLLLLWDLRESNHWQSGFKLLPAQWNSTRHDQPWVKPIVAAYHGFLEPSERRKFMQCDAKNYPY